VELWFGGWIDELSNGNVFQENGLMGSVYSLSQNKIDPLFTKKKIRSKASSDGQRGRIKNFLSGPPLMVQV
jgi:hypothetical protein